MTPSPGGRLLHGPRDSAKVMGEMLAPSGFSRVGAWQRVADAAALCTGQCFWVLRAVLGVLLESPRGQQFPVSTLEGRFVGLKGSLAALEMSDCSLRACG